MAPRRISRAQVVLSIAVLALGSVAAALAFRLPTMGGYARIGPNAMPIAVSVGLIVLGAWLLVEALRSGWRAPVSDDPEVRGEHAFVWPAFGWVSAGLAAQMALIHTGGFVIAAAALFACVARGFGSRRWMRDLLTGLLLGVAVFLFFVRFLNVNLPAGWLYPLLGGAGL